MVKDGDKILVCLSGSSSSLSLLHGLRQFSRARGIHIEMGAVSLGTSGVDPRALMLYLRDLNIKYIFDQLGNVYFPLKTFHLMFITFFCYLLSQHP